MRDPKSSRNRSDNGGVRRNGSAAARGTSGAGRAGKRSRLPFYRKVERLATLLVFMAGIQVILVAGDTPLGMQLGERCSRSYYARAPFDCDDLDRANAARARARQEAPLVFRRSEAKFQIYR
ncbi:MAG: hypothetical protein QGI63_10105, partial [Rhodospirillales bacterium]|nr:hypothetical protein [Rhodospirillales bacterium]